MRTAIVLALALVVLAPASLALVAPPEEPEWAPAIVTLPLSADQTTLVSVNSIPTTGGWIGPGAHLLITFDSEPGFIYGCTANFLFTNPEGTVAYEWNGEAPRADRKPAAPAESVDLKARKPSGHAGH